MGEVMPLTPEDVSNKLFTPVRLREGYDMGEVDQFLDEAGAAIGASAEARVEKRAGRPFEMPLFGSETVQNKQFTPVRLREGYDMGEVDQFLDEIEATLR